LGPPPLTQPEKRGGDREGDSERDRALARESGGKEKERKVEFENSLLV
jgi:hypothetical protein